MVEHRYKNFVDEFVEETKWGFISDEILKYGRSHAIFRDEEVKAAYRSISNLLLKKYVRFNWKYATSMLFQSTHGKNFFSDLGKGRGGRRSLRVRNARIHDASFVFAKDKIRAYARLFVEFEEDMKELVKIGSVSQSSGYMVLKILCKIAKPMDLTQIMREIGYKHAMNELREREGFKQRRMVPLEQAGLVLEKGGTYLLSPEIAQAFYYSEKIKNEVLRWPYRDNWILPLRK